MADEISGTVLIQIGVMSSAMLLTAIMALAFRRVRPQITAFAAQSAALAAICLFVAAATGSGHVYAVAGLTIAIKCVLIPIFLGHIVHKTRAEKDQEKFFTVPTAVILSGVLILFSHYLMSPIAPRLDPLGRCTLNVSVALIFIGLLLMINRTLALTQVIGILTIENGIFLAGIATTRGMPLFIELGIFFDVIVGVVLMGVLTNKISRTFDTLDTEKLNKLKY